MSQALTLSPNTIRHPIIRDHVMTFAVFARAMTCTVVAFASLRASDNQELFRLARPNGDTLCVHGNVASKGSVLTAGEDVAVFTIDQDEGSSASGRAELRSQSLTDLDKQDKAEALTLPPNGGAFLLIEASP